MRVFRRSQSFGGATVPSHASARVQSSAQHDLPPNDSGSVLVAVNGKERGWDALEWAAAEAASRQCALRIVHAFRSSPFFVDPLGTLVDEWNAKAIEAASGVLTDAVNHARAVAPTLQVTAHMQEGSTTTAILREGSRGDALIVLGRGPNRGWFRSFISVGRRVTRHAACPVAIVHLTNGRARGLSAGRVVVGIDGAEDPAEVLGFAFRSAERRCVGVTVIYTSTPPDLNAEMVLIDDPAATLAFKGDCIESALQMCRRAHPNVEVRRRFVSVPAVRAFVSGSAGAALLVIDGHTRRARRRAVLRSAQSPVAIVRPTRARAPLAGNDWDMSAKHE
jgi:nucleotide-binding universal stress UspA family protein